MEVNANLAMLLGHLQEAAVREASATTATKEQVLLSEANRWFWKANAGNARARRRWRRRNLRNSQKPLLCPESGPLLFVEI